MPDIKGLTISEDKTGAGEKTVQHKVCSLK